jgi:hypothetical protein
MAQPANMADTYDLVGIREDLADFIDDISPTATPFYSKCGKVSVSNTYTEWQTDALAAAADNYHVEGDDTTPEAITATTRVGNRTQIFKKSVSTSGTEMAVTKAGRATELAYQIVKKTKELKRDIEYALFRNQAAVTGSSVAARRLAALGSWLATNTSEGSGGSDPTGNGTNARTDGTPRALTQAIFDGVMQTVWESGGEVDTVYTPSSQMDTVLTFVGNNAQRNTVKVGDVANVIDVYRTPWGTVEFVMDRFMRSRELYLLQSDKFQIGTLRSLKQEPLAKSGDSEKRQLVTELTLISRNEKASGAVFDLS